MFIFGSNKGGRKLIKLMYSSKTKGDDFQGIHHGGVISNVTKVLHKCSFGHTDCSKRLFIETV